MKYVLPLPGLFFLTLLIAAPAKPKATPSILMFGGSPARNMANTVEKNIPDDFVIPNEEKKIKGKHIKWVAELGDHAYGGPVIADGRIFIGTNNENPRDGKVVGDKGVVMCFRESDGKFLWQIVHDKLPQRDLNDSPRQGVISTPCIDGDRLYYVSNRCEMVCADVKGDEKTRKGKILWSYDMRDKLKVFPCQASASSPLVVGDIVYAITGNGVHLQTQKVPTASVDAPAFVGFNKKTGELKFKSSLPNKGLFRGQWSNPTAATIKGKTQIIFAGGDGWLYSFDHKTHELVWKFDCNPKGATAYKVGGGGDRCFIVAAPVVHDNKCYIAVGQEPDDGNGVGHLWCIDITKTPKGKDKDLSPVKNNFDPKAAVNKDSGLVWHHGGIVNPKPKDSEREYNFGRTMSTVAVHDGLVYAAELAGYIQCVDAKTGKKYWEFDFQETTWCSPYYVDGKVFIGTQGGDLYILKAGKKQPTVKKIRIGGCINTPTVACNGVLYLVNGSKMFAIKK